MTARGRALTSVAAGLALVAAAIAVGLLAVRVWTWPGKAEAADRAMLEAPRKHARWGGTSGLAARLLGASDDAAYRSAVALALRARPEDAVSTRTADEIVAAVEASIELSRLGRTSDDPRLRSKASNLEGVLVGEDAIFDPAGGTRVARAAELFRRAIALDPGNEIAKANLELLYKLVGTPTGTGEQSTAGFGGFGDDSGGAGGGQGY